MIYSPHLYAYCSITSVGSLHGGCASSVCLVYSWSIGIFYNEFETTVLIMTYFTFLWLLFFKRSFFHDMLKFCLLSHTYTQTIIVLGIYKERIQ